MDLFLTKSAVKSAPPASASNFCNLRIDWLPDYIYNQPLPLLQFKV